MSMGEGWEGPVGDTENLECQPRPMSRLCRGTGAGAAAEVSKLGAAWPRCPSEEPFGLCGGWREEIQAGDHSDPGQR